MYWSETISTSQLNEEYFKTTKGKVTLNVIVGERVINAKWRADEAKKALIKT